MMTRLTFFSLAVSLLWIFCGGLHDAFDGLIM